MLKEGEIYVQILAPNENQPHVKTPRIPDRVGN
jgi:cell division protein FtsB